MKKTTLLLAGAFLLILQSCSKKENLQGHNVTQPSLDGNKHINWTPGDVVTNGNYKFINSGTFKSMEIAGQSLVDGTQAQQWTYHDQTSQQWTVTLISGSDFKIINTNSGKALAAPLGDNSEGAILRQNTYDGTNRMIWNITFVGGTGLYKLVNKGNGLVATLEGSGTTDGTVITQRTYDTAAGYGNTKQWWGVQLAGGTVYFVSKSGGSDANTGLTSTVPWKTLTQLTAGGRIFFPGDWVLLKDGDTWTGETLTLKGQGVGTKHILLASYGTGAKPAIQPSIMDEACIKLIGNSGWTILNMDLSKAKDGIRASYDQIYDSDYLDIESCTIHDIDNTYNSSPDFFNHNSSGILVEGYTPMVNGQDNPTAVLKTILTNLTIKNCTFNNCNHGVNAVGTPSSHCNIYGYSNGDLVRVKNFTIADCTATNCNQSGMGLVDCANGTVTNFDTNTTGNGTNHTGNAAFVVGRSNNIVFDGCDISNSYRGPYVTGTPPMHIDGDGFDFEGGVGTDGTGPQHDITYKNAAINYTEGAGIFIYDNGGGTTKASKNCVISNVTVSRFGQTDGNIGAGIHFTTGTTGTITNVTLNRNAVASGLGWPFRAGSYTGFTFSGYVENNIP